MVWGIRAPVWFGLFLISITFFIWCILAAVESEEAMGAGLTWGLIIFGVIAIASGIIAIVAQSMSGGVVRAREALTQRNAAPPRSASTSGTMSASGYDHKSSSEIPRSSPGRSLT